MKKTGELTVMGTTVRVVKINGEDFVCLTDMLKSKDGEFFFSDWLRNRNTVEFLGIWEQVNKPDFNYGEFAIIKIKNEMLRTIDCLHILQTIGSPCVDIWRNLPQLVEDLRASNFNGMQMRQLQNLRFMWTRLSQTRRIRTDSSILTRLRQSRPRILQLPQIPIRYAVRSKLRCKIRTSRFYAMKEAA